MLLSALLSGLTVKNTYGEREIGHLTSDSRRVNPGDCYFCLRGTTADGHDYAAKAVEQGAAAVVCQRPLGLPNEVMVEDTHYAYAAACANFFGNPQESLKLIGVTGTNGKTTITYLLRDALRAFGKKVGMIGTVETDVDGETCPAKYTTPDPLIFFSLLAQMRDAGCEYAVMEVSSHGLDQKRTGPCRFIAGIFTNLTKDHLDYHGTMERYFAAKASLFDRCGVAVVNADDPWGARLAGMIKNCPVRTFSAAGDTSADSSAKSVDLRPDGSRFAVVTGDSICRMRFPIPGMFSVANALAALTCLCEIGFPLEEAAKNLCGTGGVPGRFEVIRADVPFTVIRDYAHAPDAIEKVLTALRAVTDGRIVILFGCAGRRDRTKRPDMTAAAARLADFVILSSDNPREEDEMQIINDAMPGLTRGKTPYKVIPDRYEAVEWALRNCRPGDTLLLAGKGHEQYQVLSHATVHFDEREIVAEILERIAAEREAKA